VGSILDVSIVVAFNLPNPFGRTLTPGWTQFLTEMSTRNLRATKSAAGS
jgi:hypothetical protein